MAKCFMMIRIVHDPLIKELMDIAATNEVVRDNVFEMNAKNELFVTTGSATSVQVHLSDKALDLLYHYKGAI